MPLALTLGILAALLEFIPNFGPILAAVPAVLLALLLVGGQKGVLRRRRPALVFQTRDPEPSSSSGPGA